MVKSLNSLQLYFEKPSILACNVLFITNHETIICYQLTCLPVECFYEVFFWENITSLLLPLFQLFWSVRQEKKSECVAKFVNINWIYYIENKYYTWCPNIFLIKGCTRESHPSSVMNWGPVSRHHHATLQQLKDKPLLTVFSEQNMCLCVYTIHILYKN